MPPAYRPLPRADRSQSAVEEGRPAAASKGGGLRRVAGLAREEAPLLSAACFALVVGVGASLAIPALIGRVMDTLHDKSEGARDELRRTVFRLCVVVAVSAVASFFRASLITTAGQRVVARLRKRLFRAVISQEVAFFAETRSGEITSRLVADTTSIRSAATVNLSVGLRTSLSILASLCYLFVISWRLSLLMVSTVPVVAVAARRYGAYVRRLSKDAQDALAKASEVAEEAVSQVRTVRSFAQEAHHLELYSARIETSYGLGRRLAVAYGSFTAFMSVVAGGAIIGILYYGSVLVLDGDMSVGDLTSFILYTISVGGGVAGLAGLFADFSRAIGASDRVFELLDREPAIDSAVPFAARAPTEVRVPPPPPSGRRSAAPAAYAMPTAEQRRSGAGLGGTVELRDVRFAYPSRPDAAVLDGFSLVLRPGTTTALVGKSGMGKSTAIRLLLRHYDVQGGAVLFDGRDVREYDPRWLHGPRAMAVVEQEPALFCDSVWANIAYGVEAGAGADAEARFDELPAGLRERITDAARAANAHGFVSELADGYDTVVGERGVMLSGGQRQRVAIARAVMVEPQVLLLDESTSALDAESERLVQEALATLRRGRTTLVVAHRLSTVRDSDAVAVVDGGRVAELGTHDELLDRSGIYARLVENQLA